MSGHGHGHGGGHGHGCCECEHEPAERGVEYELYKRIDIEKLQCLNESRDGDGKLVFKPWDQRTDREKVPRNLPVMQEFYFWHDYFVLAEMELLKYNEDSTC